MERKVSYYQDGNTVRKIYDYPVNKPETKRRENRELHKKTYRNVEKSVRMSGKMIVVLALSVFASVGLCINYLESQADIAQAKANISSLESSIETLSARNNSIQYEIDSFIDIENIIKKAKEELGMVTVNEDQVKTYESSKIEYMDQYNDVPEK